MHTYIFLYTFKSFQIKPYAMLNKASSGGDDQYEGYIIDLMERIAAKYGVRAHVRVADGVGERQAGGGWTGMLGDISSGVSLTESSNKPSITQRTDIVIVPLDYRLPCFV